MTNKHRTLLISSLAVITVAVTGVRNLSSQSPRAHIDTPTSQSALPDPSSTMNGTTRLDNASVELDQNDPQYLRSDGQSQVYELDLNPTGSLTDDDLNRALHEKQILLRRLNVETGAYDVVGDIDVSGISTISGMSEDWERDRLFIQEYVGRAFYRYWVIDAKNAKVVGLLDATSSEPIMPLVVNPDGNQIYLSWKREEVAGAHSNWQTSIIDGTSYKTMAVSKEFTIHEPPFGLESSEFSEDGKWLYTYEFSSNLEIQDSADTLLVIDASDYKPIKSIPYSSISAGKLTIVGIRGGKAITIEELGQSAGLGPSFHALVYDLNLRKLVSRAPLPGFSEGSAMVDRGGKKLVVNTWKKTAEGELVPAGLLTIFDVETGRRATLPVSGTVLLSTGESFYIDENGELDQLDVAVDRVVGRHPLTRQTPGKN